MQSDRTDDSPPRSGLRTGALILQVPTLLIALYLTIRAFSKEICPKSIGHVLAVLAVDEALEFDVACAICFGLVIYALRRRKHAFAMTMSVIGLVTALVMLFDAFGTGMCLKQGF